MATDMWRPTIERMLARVRDTAAQLDTGLPHWADPETGHWTTLASMRSIVGRHMSVGAAHSR